MTAPLPRPATPGEIARSLAFYALFYGVSALLVVAAVPTLAMPRSALVAMVRAWCGWHRWCCRVLLGITVRIEGRAPDRPVLVAMRHESYFEAIDLPNLLATPMVFAKRELLAIPLWGALGRRYGLIAVDRAAGARALRTMVAAASRHNGRALVIFPEGTRVPHGQRIALQAGFAGLYKLLGLPVVPVAVDSGALYHRLWKRSGVITVRFGEELPAGMPRAAIEARVLAAINSLNG